MYNLFDCSILQLFVIGIKLFGDCCQVFIGSKPLLCFDESNELFSAIELFIGDSLGEFVQCESFDGI